MKKNIYFTLLFLFLFLTFYAVPSIAITYTAGIEDNFASPADPASPSTILSNIINATWTTADFDLTIGLNGGSPNRWIAHTFSGLPTGIISATLELTIQGGNDDWAWNDDFWLTFYDDPTDSISDAIAYRVALGNRDGTTVGLTEMEWGPGSVATLNLDLSALPLPNGTTTSVMTSLNTYGFIDVIVADDTAVDYMRLNVNPVPEPSTILLVATGLIGLAGFRKKFKK